MGTKSFLLLSLFAVVAVTTHAADKGQPAVNGDRIQQHIIALSKSARTPKAA